MRVDIKPEMLRWARERAGMRLEALVKKFAKAEAWEIGETQPTFKQVEKLANTLHVPIGYLFLQDPPVESIPIPDFRTGADGPPRKPSPNLLDTIYICQLRQEWYRDFARMTGEEPLHFVGTTQLNDSVEATATRIRRELGVDLEERRRIRTWTEALRQFIEQADSLGILVMCSGVVQNNNYRHLDPAEFRGFAMADDLAPLIYINGADTKAAQMFTLAHELAHIWLGQSALSDTQASLLPKHEVERWCNQVAAELLVPLDVLREEYQPGQEVNEEMQRLARRFKVSTLVVLRRIYDAGKITKPIFWDKYQEELRRIMEIVPKGGGGDFYLTQAVRVSKRFARALVVSTLEGQTLHTDAFRMLGFSKLDTFHELGRSLGVPV